MLNPGKIVKTKSGKLGRTFNSKGLINGKVPVYLADVVGIKNLPDGDKIEAPLTYHDKAILCDPSTLELLGFID